MSRINGEKARAALQKRKLAAQRMKARVLRAAAGEKATAAAAAPAPKPSKKRAAKASE
jgi:hypothetical protein